MSDDNSLVKVGEVNVGDVMKPVNTLVKKISSAIGELFRPIQIRRVARAEADAAIIKAESEILIFDLQQRAMERFVSEEVKKQQNIESITQKALPFLKEDATPDEMEDDWIVNLFDKGRLISDDEMQLLFSKILAGEANEPGTYSKRTVNALGSLDKHDATTFRELCAFTWTVSDELTPLVFDAKAPIYDESGATFEKLSHLDSIGLVQFHTLGGVALTDFSMPIRVDYFGHKGLIERLTKENTLPIGEVVFTQVGKELAPICGAAPNPAFVEYALAQWKTRGIECTLTSADRDTLAKTQNVSADLLERNVQ